MNDKILYVIHTGNDLMTLEIREGFPIKADNDKKKNKKVTKKVK